MNGLLLVTLGLLAAPPAAPPAAPAFLLPAPGAPRGRALALGAELRTDGTQRHEVRLRGGCLLRLAPRSRIRLDAAATGTRCATVTLLQGRLGVVASRRPRPALLIRLTHGAVRVHHGVGLARSDHGIQGVCLRTGGGQGLQRPAAAPPAAAPPAAKIPATGRLRPGRCLWLGKTQTTESTFRARSPEAALLRTGYRFVTPRTPVVVDLAGVLARLRASALGGAGGGSSVEGGGQSMCLDTGSEGSAADLGGVGGVDIVKPPPPTRLRLHIQLNRTGR